MLLIIKMLKKPKSSEIRKRGRAIEDDVMPEEVLCSLMSNKLGLQKSRRISLASVTRKRVPSYQSSLRFDFDWCRTFCVPLQDHEVYEQHPCSCFYDVKFQFVRSVNQYLEAYKGTNILLFKVSFCLGNGFSDDIDQWISFAIKMGIEELVLELQCEKNRPTPTTNNILELDKQMEGNYVLQGDLFEGATTKLKHLHLVACSIGTNFTQHFNFLETLTLAASPLALYDIHSLFSCMVNLKQLFLERCTLPVKLCLGSLLLLNRFYIKCCAGIKEIELSNADLLYIDFTNTETILSNLSGVPNLERLGYVVDGRMMRNIFTNVSKHLPKLTALTVCCPDDDWVQCVPESINVFCNVDYLLLFLAKETKFDILKMVSILGAFPSLRRFFLNMRCPKDTEQEEKLLQRSEYVPRHLQHVEIKGFHGTPNQIEFTIHLLKHTSTLKKLVIKHEFLSVKRQSWDEGERQMVYQRLQEFSKDVMLIVQ